MKKQYQFSNLHVGFTFVSAKTKLVYCITSLGEKTLYCKSFIKVKDLDVDKIVGKQSHNTIKVIEFLNSGVFSELSNYVIMPFVEGGKVMKEYNISTHVAVLVKDKGIIQIWIKGMKIDELIIKPEYLYNILLSSSLDNLLPTFEMFKENNRINVNEANK